MLSFANPLWLLLLVIPVLLMYWVWTRTSGRIAFPFDHAPPLAKQQFWPFLLRCVESLPVLVLAIAILIVAGPQKTGVPQTRRSLANIQFCLDVSGSMSVSFGEATRYDGAMNSINQFLDHREGDAFGLTFFGDEVVHWTPLTTDASAIKCSPPFMHPNNPARPPWFGGTSIGKALLACRDVLVQRSEGDRLIILISDGASADLNNGRDQEIAKLLSDDGIVVYDIHIADGEVPVEIGTITMLTGGEVFQAGDPEGMAAVFAQIDKMEPAKMERTIGELMDNYQPYCLIALCLAGVFQLSQLGWRYTPW